MAGAPAEERLVGRARGHADIVGVLTRTRMAGPTAPLDSTARPVPPGLQARAAGSGTKPRPSQAQEKTMPSTHVVNMSCARPLPA